MPKQTLLFCVLVLVVLDMVLCSDVVLQLVCLVLVAVICGGGIYIRHKQSTGIWLTKQQYNDLHDLAKESILNRNI